MKNAGCKIHNATYISDKHTSSSNSDMEERTKVLPNGALRLLFKQKYL